MFFNHATAAKYAEKVVRKPLAVKLEPSLLIIAEQQARASHEGWMSGKIAQGYIDNGQLIPDELMIGILGGVYDKFKGSKGVIFDGFPRTIAQAEALKAMLEERGESLSAMINLEVSEDILMARLLRRATLEGRADDNEETIKKRFAVYHNQTAPLIEWFKQEGVFKGFTYTDELGLEGMVTCITEYINTII